MPQTTKQIIQSAKKVKPMTSAESMKYVKTLLKSKTNIKKKLQPGRIIMFKYNAKDKVNTYDQTPMVMVLKSTKRHMLGINFHWLPIPMRVVLVKKILSLNKRNIKNNVPLVFNYGQLRPFLKRLGYAPVIRLYIRTRISANGALVPDDQLMNISRTKTETFTHGRVSAQQLYKKAVKNVKRYRKFRKRRQ